MRKQFPHLHTILEIADLLGQPQSLIRRMVHTKRCPPWVWFPRWKEPRFRIETLTEWARMLGSIDPDELPEKLEPLQRPAEVFPRRHKGPDPDLELILKHFPVRVAERLRAKP